MNIQETLTLFDTYVLTVPKGLTARTDGASGKRGLVLTDREEMFVISFEEGMELMDLKPLPPSEGSAVRSDQCCRNGKYIHLRRSTDRTGTCGFFHIELEDAEGRTLFLPGRITANSACPQADGIAPVLLELMDGLDIIGRRMLL